MQFQSALPLANQFGLFVARFLIVALLAFLVTGMVQAQSFTAVAAGDSHICGLLDTGEVRCSTTISTTRYDIPNDAPLMSAISAGQQHSCGITLDGNAYCWGNEMDNLGNNINGNGFGELDIPAIDASLQSIAAGINHTCAVDTNGKAWCWGLNANGQSEPPDDTFLKVDGGVNYSCGIRAAGDIACWTTDPRYIDTDLVDDVVFIDLDLSRANACGLSVDGTIHCWEQLFVPPANGPYVDIAVTNGSICGLTSAGELDCTFNYPDLSRDEAYAAADYPQNLSLASIESNSDIFSGRTMCGVKTDGELACWGGVFEPGPPSIDGESADPAVSAIDLSLAATIYGRHSVELFWTPLPSFNNYLRVEVYRDDELITTVDARFSYFDSEMVENDTSTYRVRTVGRFGDTGAFSNSQTVNRNSLSVVQEAGQDLINPHVESSVKVENLQPVNVSRSLAIVNWNLSNPQNLPIAGYEIRVDGVVSAFTDSLIYVDRQRRDGYCRIYSIAAISLDGAILDFDSTAIFNSSSGVCRRTN